MSKEDITPYIPHTKEDRDKILKTLNIKEPKELLKNYPQEFILKNDLNISEGLSEQALTSLMKNLANKNITSEDVPSFLGAGSYSHYSPAIVDSVISKPGFFSAYTPYQPEISQGTLQSLFEFQTLICQLTGMDVSNASIYDGASATAEAALMALRIKKKKDLIIAKSLHPEYKETIYTYLASSDGKITEIDFHENDASLNLTLLKDNISEDTAGVIVQSPNFFGTIEDIEKIADLMHEKNALLITVITEALSMALLKSHGELGADIVVGEAMSFGCSTSFGGPYCGFMATRDKFLRQMPGRLCGETIDKNGKLAYCLTLSTREQHIRREKATSNICTNQGLITLAVSAYLTCLGKGGLKDLAKVNLSKKEFLKNELSKIDNLEVVFNGPSFNEFTIKVKGSAKDFLDKMLEKGIKAGVALERFYPELTSHILLCVTELNSRQDMEKYVSVAKNIISESV